MRPAYLTSIKNEEKLIGYNLQYYYNIGIRDFYITFNCTEDKSKEIVNDFCKKHNDITVYEFHDNNPTYNLIERFNYMADLAYTHGCDWMIPVDADEILKLNTYNLIESLEVHERHEYGYIVCRWCDYVFLKSDDENDNNYFSKWTHREQRSRPQSKIIAKWHPQMKWGTGHHLVISMRKQIAVAHKMFVAHFPNREYEQLKNKMITIGKAFILKYGENSETLQVKQYKEYLEKGEQYFVDLWAKLQNDKEKRKHCFVYDPIPKEMFFENPDIEKLRQEKFKYPEESLLRGHSEEGKK